MGNRFIKQKGLFQLGATRLGVAQDILFKAHLHPKHLIADLTTEQCQLLHSVIIDTVQAVIANGGRNDEVALFGNPGGYVRLMDNQAAGKPCPLCGTLVEKMSYLGGACYYCPHCQA